MKFKIDKVEILRHLKEQHSLLSKACNRYDEGDILEAKNIANRIRLFVHNTKNSHSLIKQISLSLNKKFRIETFQDFIKPNSFFYIGPTISISANKTNFVPVFDFEGMQSRELDYKEWWEEILFVLPSSQNVSKKFSRKDIISTFTNQDGGVHVDPSIDEDYKLLTQGDLTHLKQYYSNGNNFKVIEKDIPHVIVRESGFFLVNAINKYFSDLI